VFSLAIKSIAILALCSTVGLQWLALQSVAWTAMMFSNARQVSFCEAVKRTFDGAHPCSLCHAVNKGKASQPKRDLQPSTATIDIVCESRLLRLLPRLTLVEYARDNARLLQIQYSPLAPPPRSLLS